MKWLVFVIAFASGCHAVADVIVCSAYSDEYKQQSCAAAHESDRAYERDQRRQAERRAVRERDEDMKARQEYRAAVAPCGAGDARACFVTALYEDRHGAPSAQVEPRYRFACVGGIRRACFMAGAHARTRVGTDVIDKRSAGSISAHQLALASFTHGCELGDGESCQAGLELDPARTDLLETACAAHYRWACTTLGR